MSSIYSNRRAGEVPFDPGARLLTGRADKMPDSRGPSRNGESAPEFVVTEAMGKMPIGRVRQDA